MSRITQAMLRRCKQLAQPRAELTRRSRFATSFTWHAPTGSGGMTYVMIDKLEDAGLIRWVDTPTHHDPHAVKAELTELARAELERSTPTAHS